MIKQKTIKKDVRMVGLGVHSGVKTAMVLRPAKADQGIVFRHVHFPGDSIRVGKIIPERAMHATVLKHSKWSISTTEHLMAAIMAIGVDNLVIEVDGPEIPIFDGSSLPFTQEILSCGLQIQDACKRFIFPKEKLVFNGTDGRMIEISPAEKDANGVFDRRLLVEYEADFSHPLMGSGVLKGCIDQDFFLNQIAPARTFGFLEQLPFLRKHGLARGSSLGNTVVIGEDGFINKCRFTDEFARHKLLDLIGDLGLLGILLIGRLKAQKTGHSFNGLVVEHFVQNPDQWKII